MSLVRDWRLAKRRYDEAHLLAKRRARPLEACLSAVEYYLQAVRDNRLEDKAHMRRISVYLDEFSPETIQKTKVGISRELQDISAMEARPVTGIERALNDLERILSTAEKLIAKSDVSSPHWHQYRQRYDGCTHRLMAANDIFEDFSNRRANMEAKLSLRLDHAAILKQIALRSRAVHSYLLEKEIAG